MYFLPSEIARLVLGYLEEEKCDSVYESFLTTSSNLTECLQMREMGRKFRTKVMGLSLTQILNEYLAISSTVDERLEKVDPEAANSLRNSGSLLDKVTFLLNANSSGQTMLFSITLPHGKSPTKSAVAHVRKRFKSSNIRLRKKSRLNDNDNSICENEEFNESKNKLSDVDATPLCSLPGNINLDTNRIEQNLTNKPDDTISKTPKRKANSTLRKPKPVTDVIEENLDFSILTKALLDNHAFHEKLAENINKVRTPEVVESIASTSIVKPPNPPVEIAKEKVHDPCSSNLIYQSSFYTELDNAFKKIVQETEADPVFKNILLDVITEENSDECEDKRISHTSTPNKNDQKPDKLHKDSEKINESRINSKNNSVTENNKEHITPSKIIEDQNFDAIQSIIAVNSKQQEQQENTKDKSSQDLNATMDSMLCDSHLNISSGNNVPATEDNNVVSSTENSTATTTTVTTINNTSDNNTVTSSAASIITTTMGNITVTPSTSISTAFSSNTSMPQSFVIPQQTSNIVVITQANSTMITQPTFVLANSAYQTVDNQLLVISQPKPASQYVLRAQQPQPTTVLTERDIMNMPTIFMYEKDAQKNYTITQPVYSAPAPPPKPKVLEIQPKLPDHQKSQPKPQVSITLYANDEKDGSNDGQSTKMNIGGNFEINISPVKQGKSVPMISLDSAIKEITTPNICTPPKPQSQSKQSMSTPRSGRSHIRALDFSTPPKEDELSRKANTSPKSAKNSALKRSSSKKRLKKGLFSTAKKMTNSPIKLPIPVATRVPTVKLSGDWDSVHGTSLILGSTALKKDKNKRSWDEDLRALFTVQTVEEVNKTSKKTNKKTNAKKKKENLNNTEEEANRIEALMNKTNNEDENSNKKAEDDSKKSEDKSDENVDKVEIKKSTRSRSKSNGRKTSKSPVKKEVVNNAEAETVGKKETQRESKKERLKETKTEKKGPKTPKINPRQTKKKVGEIENQVPENQENENNDESNKIRNMNARIRKKCNAGESFLQKENKVEETSKQSVQSQTILTPSKLLPQIKEKKSKKSKTPDQSKMPEKEAIIEKTVQPQESENIAEIQPQVIEYVTKTVEVLPIMESNNVEIVVSEIHAHNDILDKITPTTSKIYEDIPITFKTNLTPILETPMKFDTSLYPITPRIFTPFGNQETPFTKILNENLGSVDFSTIPTPNFPITPNFSNLTPGSQFGDDRYNRPTDYSTSSSYYQPSDCEQQQIMDTKLIEESKKFDSIGVRDTNTSLDSTTSDKPNVSLLESVEINATVIEKVGNKSMNRSDCSCLNSSQSSNSSSSSSDCSCTTDSSSSSSDVEENTTVIQKNVESPPKKYMLRSRKTPSNNLEENMKKATPLKISLTKKEVTKVKKAVTKQNDSVGIKNDLSDKKEDNKFNDQEKLSIEGNDDLSQRESVKILNISDQNTEDLSKKNMATVNITRAMMDLKDNCGSSSEVPSNTVVKDEHEPLVIEVEPKPNSVAIEIVQNEKARRNIKTQKTPKKERKTPKKSHPLTTALGESGQLKNLSNSIESTNIAIEKKLSKTPKKGVTPKKPSSAKKPLISRPSTSGTRIARRQTKIDKTVLESLAEKRQRVVANMKNEPNVKKAPPKKSKQTKPEPDNEDPKIEQLLKPTPSESPKEAPVNKLLKKSISIDFIATKLRDQKTGQLTVNLEEIPALNKIAKETQCLSQMKNLEHDIVQFNAKMVDDSERKGHDDIEGSHDESEDFPRLHLSSDEEGNEEEHEELEVENKEDIKKLQDLKDRGIHLVPKAKEKTANVDTKNKIIIHEVVVVKKGDNKITNQSESIKKQSENTEKPTEDFKTPLDKNPSDNKPQSQVSENAKQTTTQNLNEITNLEKSSTESINISFVYNEAEVEFDCQSITDYDFNFVYDPQNVSNRKFEKEEIDKLNKRINKAVVYSDELELEQVRPLKATDYYEISISPKKITKSKTKKDVISTSDHLKTVEKNKGKITNDTIEKAADETKGENKQKYSNQDDDLFDFAVTSNFNSNKNEGQELNWKKRKLIETSTPKQNPEKRIKQDDTKLLLKHIDVDKFLSQVHGPST